MSNKIPRPDDAQVISTLREAARLYGNVEFYTAAERLEEMQNEITRLKQNKVHLRKAYEIWQPVVRAAKKMVKIYPNFFEELTEAFEDARIEGQALKKEIEQGLNKQPG